MIGVIATLKVQPDKAAAFEAAFGELMAKVKAGEPGCLVYQLTRSRTEAGTYKVMEIYADEASLKAHGQSDHYCEALPKLGPFMAGAPEVEYLDAAG